MTYLTGPKLACDAYAVTAAKAVQADAAGNSGQVYMVTDEAGGPVPAYSDGTNWRRFSDGAVVS